MTAALLADALLESADEVQSFPHPTCCDHLHVAHDVMRQAAALLRTQAAALAEREWIAVSERLPEPGFPVLVVCGSRVLRAAHAPRFTLSCDAWGEFEPDGGEYDEATEARYWPEGWYEWNQHEETHWRLDAEPTHWQPLPAPPLAAAPSPNKEQTK